MGRMNAGWENWHVVRLGKTLRETAAEERDDGEVARVSHRR